jgi:transposase
VAGGCPSLLRSSKTVTKPGASPAVPSNPNSRRGRTASALRLRRVAMDKTTCGIDVSKDRLDVAVRPSGECFAVPRTGAGLDDLVARLKMLAAAGLPVAVANPAQIRAFAKAIGQRIKIDPIDVGVIAHFGEATGITPRPLPDDATQQLAELVARRRQIVEMIGSERQREKRAKRMARHPICAFARSPLSGRRRPSCGSCMSFTRSLEKVVAAGPPWHP